MTEAIEAIDDLADDGKNRHRKAEADSGDDIRLADGNAQWTS
jgi:hypothetical protein